MIITLTQAKALLKITGSTNDTLISALIPEAEAKYLQIRNFPFLQIQADYKSGDKTLSNIILYPYSNTINCSFNYTTPVKYLNRFDYITNSVIDNYITDINIYDDTIEIDTAPSTTATSALFTVYPQGAKLTAAKLIQYLMNTNSMSGLASESVGSYSVSWKNTGNPYGVPDDIFKSIKRYVTA